LKQRVRAVACVGLFALACATAPAGMPASSPSRLVGQPVPSFRRPTVQGGHFSTEGATGQVLVVEFFARYCRPCQQRLPAAERLRQENPEVRVVGISLDETPDAALEQVRRYGLGFPVIHDQGLVLAGRFRVNELPHAFVVGRDGRVLWAGGPGQPDQALRQAVRAVRQGATAVAGTLE
jgi:peroxiredoxin